MFFDKQLFANGNIWLGVWTFLSFSLIASSVYCFNDMIDVEFDKLHPEKKNRPLAKGSVSIRQAIVIKWLLFLVGGSMSYILVNINLLLVLLGYFLINILYSRFLKRIAFVDVFIVSLSFVWRIVAGAQATEVNLSYWIIVMVLSLALLLSLGKRYVEIANYTKNGIVTRVNIKVYHKRQVGKLVNFFGILVFVLYVFYCLSESTVQNYDNKQIYITSVFVFLGMLRYLFVIKKERYFGNPTRILINDHLMHLIIVSWVVSFYFLIYK